MLFRAVIDFPSAMGTVAQYVITFVKLSQMEMLSECTLLV